MGEGAGVPDPWPPLPKTIFNNLEDMTIPTDYSYPRYLAAKKSVDDRALNRQVFAALVQALGPRQAVRPARLPGSGLRHRHHGGAPVGLGDSN